MSIKDNWRLFQNEFMEATLSCGRDSKDIVVMAASKNRNSDEIRQSQALGIRHFGENRVDEARKKFASLVTEEYPLYMIGHLQSNKVKKITERFKGVHSIDSLEIAQALSIHRESAKKELEILIQVNTSGEDSKSGFRDQQLFIDAAAQISSLPFLSLRGLMVMAPFVNDESVVRNSFAKCYNWSEKVSAYIGSKPILSMGMSMDYKWAIAEGSTMIRIGSILYKEPK